MNIKEHNERVSTAIRALEGIYSHTRQPSYIDAQYDIFRRQILSKMEMAHSLEIPMYNVHPREELNYTGKGFTIGHDIYIPEESYYKFIFGFGATNDAIRICCDHARKKINSFIDRIK